METLTNGKFYVYIYLDPRKPGLFEYGLYKFKYKPFYVGKGSGKRLKNIINRSEDFKEIINNIKELKLEPIVIKIKENLNENKSFIFESELINLIGRKDLNEGSLINFTDGGEGSSGWIPTEETRKKMSEMKKGKMKDENHPMFGKKRPEHSERMKGKNHPLFGKQPSEETRKKRSEKMKGKFKGENSPLFGKHPSEKTKKLISDNHTDQKGEKNNSSILKEKDVIEISIDLNEGILTQKEIGEKFGVCPMTISDIKTGRTWSHVKIGD